LETSHIQSLLRSTRQEFEEASYAIRQAHQRLESLEKELSRSRQSMFIDPLTGLPNKKAMMSHLSDEIKSASDGKHPVSLIVFDIDGLDEINQQMGKDVGDGILVEVSARAHQLLGDDEYICRYGGEEFGVIMSGSTLQQAEELAERMRKWICGAPVEYGENMVPVTVSLGISGYRGGDDTRSLLDRARRCLRLAKKSGKNCYRSELHLKES
jgi:two-component system cell cycle response regulator